MHIAREQALHLGDIVKSGRARGSLAGSRATHFASPNRKACSQAIFHKVIAPKYKLFFERNYWNLIDILFRFLHSDFGLFLGLTSSVAQVLAFLSLEWLNHSCTYS